MAEPAKQTRLLDAVRRRFGYRMPRVGARAAAALMRRLPSRIDTELFPGIRVPLDLDQPLQAAAFWSGERSERPAPRILRGWLSGAERFFDVGANFGFYSYLALDADPRVQVHCFEPIPSLHTLHRMVCASNGLSARLHPEELGLSDTAGTLRLHVIEGELGHSTFSPHPARGPVELDVEVRVLTFDAWRLERGLALPTRPSWVLKMDIEGFEPRAIEGMDEALSARAFRGLVVELNDYTLGLCGSSTAEVRDALAQRGYREPPWTLELGGINGYFEPSPGR